MGRARGRMLIENDGNVRRSVQINEAPNRCIHRRLYEERKGAYFLGNVFSICEATLLIAPLKSPCLSIPSPNAPRHEAIGLPVK